MSLFETKTSMLELMKDEVREISERRGEPGNTHECYARIADAAEQAAAAESEWKKIIKSMWQCCKDKDTDAFDAYVTQINSTAMMSAMLWLTVAAEADRALGRADDQ